MNSVLRFIFFVICVVCGTVNSLPCLTNKSKQDFNKARDALKILKNYLKSRASSINSKIQALDKDMTSMEEDFKRRQWVKYNNHCYYIGDDSVMWTEAEDSYVFFLPILETSFWLGSTDVVNDDWRWIYDQTQLSYKNFYSGRPYPTSNSKSYTYNCMTIYYSNCYWYDSECQYGAPFVCERRQWVKYNNHCYYIGDDSVRWTDAERKCREIGGYLVKIDDSSENSWIYQQINNNSEKTYYWLGSTDVVHGDWRWIYDQTQLSYKNFYSGRPFPVSNANTYNNNCIKMKYSNGLWKDEQCQYTYPYVCESNFCKFYTTAYS
ncbi:MRC [Mytilus coruscus]|uniref:MRC n=1 Tax=Mytilus coruscus TaxID=42192 RepID=A0A6J8A676_MYTCO|nr:MRC [Mytilus coruscus]